MSKLGFDVQKLTPNPSFNCPEEKLRAALMVLDVTIACIEPFLRPEMRPFFEGQINAAREAYKEVTGEEPFELRRLGAV